MGDPPGLVASGPLELLLDHVAVFHNERDTFQRFYVVERVLGNRYDIRGKTFAKIPEHISTPRSRAAFTVIAFRSSFAGTLLRCVRSFQRHSDG